MMFWVLTAAAGPRTAMVGFHTNADEAHRAITDSGGVVGRCFDRARFCVADFPGTAPLPLQRLGSQPGIRYAEADLLIEDAAQGSYPDVGGTSDCGDLWELDEIGAPAAWSTADGSSGPVVAVADGGFLQTHEELSGRISGQYDYGDGDANANLEWDVTVPAHGTFIAGIIAARSGNGAGRAGVAPEGRVNLLKIADSSGAFYFSYAASALADVADGDLGIRAVNYSIASSSYTQSFRDAVEALGPLDILLVAAAGNCSVADCSDADNDRYPLYPANFSFDHVLSVAGSVPGGGRNSYSHFGASTVDLAAPGVDLCSLGVNSQSDYFTASGTSYAAPIVSAAVALLIEAHPDLTALEVARTLRASSAPHSDWASRARSGGVLDLDAALQTAVPRLDPPAGVTIDKTGTVEVDLENVGAAGDGIIVLFHDRFVATAASGGWQVTPFEAGDTISLPDADDHVAEQAGTLLDGSLASHSTRTVTVQVAGRSLGTEAVQLRLVATSGGADYLNAPYDGGGTDETGFLACSFDATVTEVSDDIDEPGDTGGHNTGPADTDDGITEQPGEKEESKASGCSVHDRSGGGWVLLAGALLGLGRRMRYFEGGGGR